MRIAWASSRSRTHGSPGSRASWRTRSSTRTSGGPFGNTHIAVGKSIQNCYAGDPGKVTGEEWERLGFNDSVVHCDIVSTTDRRVTAVMRDGSERTIYAGGRFELEP